VVQVTDSLDEGDKVCLVMDFVEGDGLAGRIKRPGVLSERAPVCGMRLMSIWDKGPTLLEEKGYGRTSH
jgi:hypothetical protein